MRHETTGTVPTRGHTPGMLKPFEAKYTPEQREAIDFAYSDRRIRPARRVHELAKNGELVGRAGKTLEPFDINERSIRSIASKAERERLGVAKTRLTEVPERDAKAELKRRLIAMADRRTQAMLDKQARDRDGKIDAEELRLMARAVREINSIPEPKDASGAAKPGQRVAGSRAAGERTRGGHAGALIVAMRGDGRELTPGTREGIENGDGPGEPGPSGAAG